MGTACTTKRNDSLFRQTASIFALLALGAGCDGAHSKSSSAVPPPAVPSVSAAEAATIAVPPVPPAEPKKVEVQDEAMGTSLHFVTYTSATLDEAEARAAIAAAIAEMRRLELILSEWLPESELSHVNAKAGEWVTIGPETSSVIERGLWAGKLSSGSFDITFQALSKVWKFGSAQEEHPKPPRRADIEKLRPLVDYRKVELDEPGHRVRIGKGQQLGLGGIAKGYIVDRAAKVLHDAGVQTYLVQAGGDLYGAGHKPDGAPWVSGIQDPRGEQGRYFAVIELDDHAFSTAGDYARSYVVDGKRYHHIIDPKTGYPAVACRSVTIWAPDATTADGIDDAVFILGPERGLSLVESLEGVGAVIVDAQNRVFISERVKDKVRILSSPTDAL